MGGSVATLCEPSDKALRSAEQKRNEAKQRAQEALHRAGQRAPGSEAEGDFAVAQEFRERSQSQNSSTSEAFFTPRGSTTPSIGAPDELAKAGSNPPSPPPPPFISSSSFAETSSSMAAASSTSQPPEEIEDEDQPNSSLLSAIFSQLRIGMDLSKVTLPTFLLEPRSLLEKWTDFFSNPQYIIKAIEEKDPMERFIGVLRWYLSGVHVKPKGAKKPYNPILGEVFFGEWNLDIGRTTYIAEQVSHHPPISAFHLENKQKNFVVYGWCLPRTKFLGNSASSTLEGRTIAHFKDLDEEYIITMPVVYVKGLFVGTLGLDVGGKGTIECPKTGLFCEMEFKNKGLFGAGENNSVQGEVTTIDNKKDPLFRVFGRWDQSVYISPGKAKPKKNETIPGTRQLFDVSKLTKQRIQCRPEIDMDAFESRRLWNKVTKALAKKDQEVATDQKSFLEDMQRRAASDRKEREEEWAPKYFKTAGPEDPHWTYVYSGAESWEAIPKKATSHLPVENGKRHPFVEADMDALHKAQEEVYGPKKDTSKTEGIGALAEGLAAVAFTE